MDMRSWNSSVFSQFSDTRIFTFRRSHVLEKLEPTFLGSRVEAESFKCTSGAFGQRRKETVMADNQNPGQFGNRNDTEEQARKGGQQSPGQFGASEGANPSKAGQEGGQESPGRFDRSEGADPSKAGQKGGEQSPGQFGASEGADPSAAGRKGGRN